MPAVFEQAVCIRHWDWSETSQTVSVLTRERGIIRGIAKGARRENAPFSGGIELLAVGEVGFILKPSRTESALTTLTSWDLREHFVMPRRSLTCFNMAMGGADAIQKSLREFDPHPETFDAFLIFLREMEQGSEPTFALSRFLWTLVDDLGYGIDLDRDVQTQQPLDLSKMQPIPATDAASAISEANHPIAWFVPEKGGFTLSRVAGAWGTRGSTFETLRGISRGSTSGIDPGDATMRSVRLLASYLGVVIEAEIPALQLALQSTQPSAAQSSPDARAIPASAPTLPPT